MGEQPTREGTHFDNREAVQIKIHKTVWQPNNAKGSPRGITERQMQKMIPQFQQKPAETILRFRPFKCRFAPAAHLQVLHKISGSTPRRKGGIQALRREVRQALKVGIHHDLLLVRVLKWLHARQAAVLACDCRCAAPQATNQAAATTTTHVSSCR